MGSEISGTGFPLGVGVFNDGDISGDSLIGQVTGDVRLGDTPDWSAGLNGQGPALVQFLRCYERTECERVVITIYIRGMDRPKASLCKRWTINHSG